MKKGCAERLSPYDVDRLMTDVSIIRNRKKIEAGVANAQTIQDLARDHSSFCNWFYRVLEGDDLAELQKSLRGTFRFIGPEIARMWLMASVRIRS